MRDATSNGEVQGGAVRPGLAAGNDPFHGHVNCRDDQASTSAAQGGLGGPIMGHSTQNPDERMNVPHHGLLQAAGIDVADAQPLEVNSRDCSTVCYPVNLTQFLTLREKSDTAETCTG